MNSSTDITVSKITARKRQAPRWVYPTNGRGRGYYSTTWREYDAKPRLYVGVDGENMAENFAYRFDRPAKLYRQQLPTILRRLGLPAGTTARWSQKAGCSCGCSPGFILDIPVTRRRNQTLRAVRRIDFWATISGTAAKVKDDPNLARVAYRAERGVAILEGSAL